MAGIRNDRSAIQMGILFLFTISLLPYLLFTLPAGVIADRFNKKRIMVYSNIARMFLIALILIVYLITTETNLLLIYVVRIGLSVFEAIYDTSSGSIIPNIVNKNRFKNANSILQMSFSVSNISGLGVSGL